MREARDTGPYHCTRARPAGYVPLGGSGRDRAELLRGDAPAAYLKSTKPMSNAPSHTSLLKGFGEPAAGLSISQSKRSPGPIQRRPMDRLWTPCTQLSLRFSSPHWRKGSRLDATI